MMSSGDLSKAINDLLNEQIKPLCIVGKIKSQLLPTDSDALENLIPEVFDLLNNNDLQNKLKQNISKLGVLNADEIIANQILDIIK